MSSDTSNQENTTTTNNPNQENTTTANPNAKKSRPILEPKTVRSWVGYEYKGIVINPIIRNQHDYHRLSCSFQALVVTVELLSWIAFLDKSSSYYHKRKRFSVDVSSLISTYSPPREPAELVHALVRDSNGYLPISETHNPRFMVFRVSDDGEELDLEHMDEDTRQQQISRLFDHVNDIGPVIGVFPAHPGYKPKLNSVHLQGSFISRNYGNVARKASHAVCITGTGSAMFEGIMQPVFQYLESSNPTETKSGDGLAYVLWDTLTYVYIPRITELPKKKK